MITQTEEQWRDIPGYEGRYQVSDQGRVRSLRKNGVRKKPRVLKGSPDKDGYYCVGLFGSDKQYETRRVSALVISVFKYPNPGSLEVRHMDGDNQNNRVENLEWGTHADNMRDKVTHGTDNRGEKSAHAKLNRDQVRALRAEFAAGTLNLERRGRDLGVSDTAIRYAVTRRNWAWLDA